MYRVWMVMGSVAGLSAVAMSAAAAHALTGLAPAMRQVVSSGLQMQGWHALALLACGLWAERPMSRARRYLVNLAGSAFTLGLILFCGALYLLALRGLATGLVAPLGGTLLMMGWLLFGASALFR